MNRRQMNECTVKQNEKNNSFIKQEYGSITVITN